MNRFTVRALAALVLPMAIATPAWAKGRTARIAITCEGLRRTVEISDTSAFVMQIQQGPWGRRFMDTNDRVATASGTRLCQVSYYAEFSENQQRDTRLAFVMYYRYDPASAGSGYVYLPDAHEPWHALNASSYNKPEHDGAWFKATRAWEDAIRAAIDHATA